MARSVTLLWSILAFGTITLACSTTGLAATTHTFGIDVSVWQGAINWNSVAASGKEFAFVKATEGVGFIDSTFLTNISGAHNAGMLVSGYHFASPYTNGLDDAAAEATHFYNTMVPYLVDGFLRPVLDLESGSQLGATVLSNWVHNFMTTFSTLSGGVVPILYTNSNFATNHLESSVNVYDLWLANWPASPDFNNPPTADGIWNGYNLWQYSSSTSVPGISGNVDGDVYFGDTNQLIADYGIVPEPATASVILCTGVLPLLQRRHRHIPTK